MSQKDKIAEKETFLRLINLEINYTIERWSDSPNDLKFYAWGYREVYDNSVTLGSNHDKCFFYADCIIKLAKAFGYSWFLTIKDNADGEPTSCVSVIFS